ncbi:MAG: arginine--tRNA ligase [Burkholderiales bacterium]|nr:arginine--tRNA ligase [Burkholderiales bacterium]
MTHPTFPDFKDHLRTLFSEAVRRISDLEPEIHLERPKLGAHGDYACNVAMQLAKPLKRNPRQIATEILEYLPHSEHVEKVEIAGAGFLNVFIRRSSKQKIARQVQLAGMNYGNSTMGAGTRVQVEFVSANPTGPLHVGHGRGAAYGASLANVLAAAGYQVEREYYVNDAGRQMDILTISTWLRYLEILGTDILFPSNAYQGSYVRDMAKLIHDAHGDRYFHPPGAVLYDIPTVIEDEDVHLDKLIANAKKLLGPDYQYIHNFVLNEQLGDCRNDLLEFGVTFDTWFSEQSLFDSGLVARAIDILESTGNLYVQDGARWFRSTHHGDEKDRVVQRENGLYTYFASDIAYHLNKLERGYDRVIDIWGADHHGYIPRVKGALEAAGASSDKLEVALVQFAVLYRDGKKASMSTRSGDFVTLRELRKEVGNDAARFFYVLRKCDQHLDFDLDLAKSQSNENPVYYIQYAHARISSVLEQWGGNLSELQDADATALESDVEVDLLQMLIDFPETVRSAARELSPHIIAFYLKDLAALFHAYYNSSHFLVEDERLRNARLLLVSAVRLVLARGLELLGVSAPEKM